MSPRLRPVLATAIVAITVAGCSTSGQAVDAPAVSSQQTPSQTTTSQQTSSAQPTTETTSAAAAEPYGLGTTRVTGRTDHATYDVGIPLLIGGDVAVRDEFNQSMNAALQDQINGKYQFDFALSDGYSQGASHIGRRVISVEQITDWIAVPPGAHGDSLLATVTIDTATAQPISLGDAFSDLDTGLARLSEQAAVQLQSTNVRDRYVRDGISPKIENFANWTASPDGMKIHFGDYQVGAYADGLITIVIPWGALPDVLAPGMEEVLSS